MAVKTMATAAKMLENSKFVCSGRHKAKTKAHIFLKRGVVESAAVPGVLVVLTVR